MDRYRDDSKARQDAWVAHVDRVLQRQADVLEAMKADISTKLDELGRKLEDTRHETVRRRIDQANHHFQVTEAVTNMVPISAAIALAAIAIAAVVHLLRLR